MIFKRNLLSTIGLEPKIVNNNLHNFKVVINKYKYCIICRKLLGKNKYYIVEGHISVLHFTTIQL